jgi:hypothetical protein
MVLVHLRARVLPVQEVQLLRSQVHQLALMQCPIVARLVTRKGPVRSNLRLTLRRDQDIGWPDVRVVQAIPRLNQTRSTSIIRRFLGPTG